MAPRRPWIAWPHLLQETEVKPRSQSPGFGLCSLHPNTTPASTGTSLAKSHFLPLGPNATGLDPELSFLEQRLASRSSKLVQFTCSPPQSILWVTKEEGRELRAGDRQGLTSCPPVPGAAGTFLRPGSRWRTGSRVAVTQSTMALCALWAAHLFSELRQGRGGESGRRGLIV